MFFLVAPTSWVTKTTFRLQIISKLGKEKVIESSQMQNP